MSDLPAPGWRYRAVVSLGSNIAGDVGSPDAQVQRAARALGARPHTQVLAGSQLYRTPPWGVAEQAEFSNAVVVLRTRLEPLELLEFCQSIEHAAHRERIQRWGPRTVDVDIAALYRAEPDGREVTSTGSDGAARWGERLILPHPYAHLRAFVLVPWAELAPGDTVAGGSVRQWLDRQPAGERRAIRPTGVPALRAIGALPQPDTGR